MGWSSIGVTMKIRTVALAVVAFGALSVPALADDPGWYLGIAAGYDIAQPVTVAEFDKATPLSKDFARLDYKNSAIYLASGGYKFGSGVRVEVEFGFDEHDAKQFVLSDGDILTAHGGTSTASALLNAAYDFDLGSGWGASLGGGLGAGMVNEYVHSGPSKLIGGTASGFEWQGIAGLFYQFTDNFQIFADYRYRSVDVAHQFTEPSDPAFAIRVYQQHEHVGLLGIRWFLGEAPPPPPPPAPPPPPPAPPPPPPVKTFIVFFDFDKSNLTAEAQSVVEEAVKTAKTNGAVKVLITGHTDTVGSDSYNQGLSVRRAETVKDEMVHEGMDGGSISIEGKSFHDPLVPTGPGVREPQNRRAVIDLGG